MKYLLLIAALLGLQSTAVDPAIAQAADPRTPASLPKCKTGARNCTTMFTPELAGKPKTSEGGDKCKKRCDVLIAYPRGIRSPQPKPPIVIRSV